MSPPLLLALCDDIFFLPRIDDVAVALGYRFKTISTKSDIGIDGDPIQREIHLTEPLSGPDAVLIRYLVDERPALIFIDTASQILPWRNWIHVIKTSAATRRIPMIAFGAHVDKQTLADASEAGADLTISRGRLQASIADLITQWATVPDMEAINSKCGEMLSDQVLRGIKLIAEGNYYKAHEILETAWKNAEDADVYLLRSLLQISVTYFHIQRGNLRGAMKMLLRVEQWMAPLPSACRGVDVAALRTNTRELRTALEERNLMGSTVDYQTFLVSIPLIEG
jgi:predicted metal-dependent hydrolase